MSTQWEWNLILSPQTDRRGEIVEDFITNNNPSLHNKASPYSTFDEPRGKSNIDLTISSSSIAKNILPHETSSEHNLIVFGLLLETIPHTVTESHRFNVKKANWETFWSTLLQHIPDVENLYLPSNIKKSALLLNNAIADASSKAIPRKKINNKAKPPWWFAELILKRRAFRNASRNRQEESGDRNLSDAYRTARNQFTAQLRKDKLLSWRTFCTKFGHKPWDRLYKWLRKGSSYHKISVTLRKPDGSFCESFPEVASIALNTLIPNDPSYINNEVLPPRKYQFRRCDSQEIKASIWKINPKEAPGFDNLTADIVRKSWPLIEHAYKNPINNCLGAGVSQTVGKMRKLL